MIPCDDFGGAGPLLHFAHANGFPPRAYLPLLEILTPHYHVLAMQARPLWTREPVDGWKSWDPLVDDLQQFLHERRASEVIGVGHSMGGSVTLRVALRDPALFRAVVLVDPVLLPPGVSFAWGLLKRLRLTRHHPIVRSAQRRRRTFESVEAMFANYRRKSVWRGLDDRGLRAYVEAMAEPQGDGTVGLRYSPDWEAKIYTIAPHELWGQVGALKPPLLTIYGEHSDTFLPASVRAMRRRLPQAELHPVMGAGHLVPLEEPAQVGQAIGAFLESVA